MGALHFDPLYSLAGVAVGILVGLTGVGGGSLMTPLLVLAFGFHPATAVGTDLLYASATKAVGTAVHGFSGTVDWKVVRRMAAGSVPATLLTLGALGYAGTHLEGTGSVITVTLGLALIATAIAMIFRTRIVAFYAGAIDAMTDRQVRNLTVALGAVLGVLVSLSSVGAGALGMTALLILYPRLPTNRLVGSDIAHAVPLTLLAGIGHWAMGSVDVGLLLSLLAGSIPGIVIGSLVSARVPDRLLRGVLAGTLAIVGGKLVF
ncbi:sulfite exporter TauE/SafE family protein [Sphingomonas immobilis]|uniref:Probable membrane transporter protein n=1 Tax=Sphingomonas immobilis TaxID=3063997 RepID=A0ABT9A249_9SPHN|nr:sulfite exporter TauE/SafE family protein [Sphingomonas sp. CA1-15]MDO7843898.1 sulfite exporter TauE/SafE family protein [Sphingomonas sp. CA1-15]